MPGDQQAVFQGLSNPEVIRYYGVSFRTMEDTRQQMQWYEELEKSHSGKWWVICLAGTSSLIGMIGIYNIHPLHRKCEIGFWLLPEYWSKGYINEAARAVIQFSFSQLHLHRIEATVETENKASIKVLLKLNFHLEGTRRQCEWKNDRWIDLHLFALLNESSPEE
jgi:ribosomal-protein-alanine N-acetyltransferase